MGKYFGLFKDLFFVYDDFKDSGYRLSETMVISFLTLFSSAMVAIFGVDLGITDVETSAIATGIMSIVYIIVRLRSKGGVSKLKEKE